MLFANCADIACYKWQLDGDSLRSLPPCTQSFILVFQKHHEKMQVECILGPRHQVYSGENDHFWLLCTLHSVYSIAANIDTTRKNHWSRETSIELDKLQSCHELLNSHLFGFQRISVYSNVNVIVFYSFFFSFRAYLFGTAIITSMFYFLHKCRCFTRIRPLIASNLRKLYENGFKWK